MSLKKSLRNSLPAMVPILALPILALPILTLAACDKPLNPTQQTAADDRAVAQIEATNRAPPPLRPITPQPLPRTFIARHAVGGPNSQNNGCAFVPKGETATVALTLGTRATLLIDGQPAIFSADTGATKLPGGAWSHYVGKALSLALAQTGAGSTIATLVISDANSRPVYQASGTLRCPAI